MIKRKKRNLLFIILNLITYISIKQIPEYIKDFLLTSIKFSMHLKLAEIFPLNITRLKSISFNLEESHKISIGAE